MRQLRVNTKDTSYDELVRVTRKAGFLIFEGGKHCKVKTGDGKPVTTIPRHNRLKRETAKAIIESMNAFGANIDFV